VFVDGAAPLFPLIISIKGAAAAADPASPLAAFTAEVSLLIPARLLYLLIMIMLGREDSRDL
jgi:hypothetical protein